MAAANRLRGAERIRGELLKLGIRVSKRTVQKYMRVARRGTPGGQRWSRFPSQAWVTQQLRNATPLGAMPRFLVRGRDDKFGTAFDALAHATGIRMVRTAVGAPNMNAICERFLGSLRRECLDHLLVLDDRHFQRVVAEYVRFYNEPATLIEPHRGHDRTHGMSRATTASSYASTRGDRELGAEDSGPFSLSRSCRSSRTDRRRANYPAGAGRTVSGGS
jgi:putative transposase